MHRRCIMSTELSRYVSAVLPPPPPPLPPPPYIDDRILHLAFQTIFPFSNSQGKQVCNTRNSVNSISNRNNYNKISYNLQDQIKERPIFGIRTSLKGLQICAASVVKGGGISETNSVREMPPHNV